MSNPKYVVSAPLVYLKFTDATGALVQSTFYQGSPVPENVDPANLQHHIDGKQVIEASDPLAEVLAVPAGTPIPGETPNEPLASPEVRAEKVRQAAKAQSKGGSSRPNAGSTKSDWVDYAVSQGADRGQAEAATKEELIEKYGA